MAAAGAPMLTVMDMSKVVARINMAQDQAKNVKVGNEATITPADGGELVTGRVTIVSPASDANSTTVQVWVQADNPGERLHAGQAVHVVDRRGDARRRDADSGAGGPAQRRGRDDRPRRRRHRTSRTRRWCRSACASRRWCRSSPASSVGERVVTQGGLGLEDKTKVRVMKPGEKAAGEEDDDDEDKN